MLQKSSDFSFPSDDLVAFRCDLLEDLGHQVIDLFFEDNDQSDQDHNDQDAGICKGKIFRNHMQNMQIRNLGNHFADNLRDLGNHHVNDLRN